MPDDHANLLRYTTEIVKGFLQSERLPADQIPGVINQVHQALTRIGQPGSAAEAQPQEPQKPAVSIRRSVQPDKIICLECGRPHRTLRRHLATAHGLSPEAYRAKWHLPRDYPMVAPEYREQRSSMAKEIGLGRRQGQNGGRRGKAKGGRRSSRTRSAPA